MLNAPHIFMRQRLVWAGLTPPLRGMVLLSNLFSGNRHCRHTRSVNWSRVLCGIHIELLVSFFHVLLLLPKYYYIVNIEKPF